MTEPKKMRAVYRDKNGASYSCPVEMRDGEWAIVTSDGPTTPIPLHFDDDVAGRLTFDCYREAEDLRLHIEPKQPGQSSLGQLQAAAAKVEAQARIDRQQQRQQALQTMNEPDVKRIQAAREYAAEVLHARKPRGSGQYIIKSNQGE